MANNNFVFTCIPTQYNLVRQLELKIFKFPWLTSSHVKKINVGDRIFLWQNIGSGQGRLPELSGLHAIAVVVESPRKYNYDELTNHNIPEEIRHIDKEWSLLQIKEYALSGKHLTKDRIMKPPEIKFETNFIGQQGTNFQISSNDADLLYERWLEYASPVPYANNSEQSAKNTLIDIENIYDKTARRILEEKTDTFRNKALSELKTLIEASKKDSYYNSNVTIKVAGYNRNAVVVMYALKRANDMCELKNCAHQTFKKPNGFDYVEVHHIVPLSEKGKDNISNVACLCPFHHREAHYGIRTNRAKITKELQERRLDESN